MRESVKVVILQTSFNKTITSNVWKYTYGIVKTAKKKSKMKLISPSELMPSWRVTFDQHVRYCIINVNIDGAFAKQNIYSHFIFDIKLKVLRYRLLSINWLQSNKKVITISLKLHTKRDTFFTVNIFCNILWFMSTSLP